MSISTHAIAQASRLSSSPWSGRRCEPSASNVTTALFSSRRKRASRADRLRALAQRDQQRRPSSFLARHPTLSRPCWPHAWNVPVRSTAATDVPSGWTRGWPRNHSGRTRSRACLLTGSQKKPTRRRGFHRVGQSDLKWGACSVVRWAHKSFVTPLVGARRGRPSSGGSRASCLDRVMSASAKTDPPGRLGVAFEPEHARRHFRGLTLVITAPRAAHVSLASLDGPRRMILKRYPCDQVRDSHNLIHARR